MQRDAIEARSKPLTSSGPALAMVDSDRGITNLHVPSDVIIDASMPAAIRVLGPDVERRRRAAGHEVRDPRPLLRRRCTPRRSSTAVSTARSTRRRWAPRRTSGLMAQAAEEYGSHDKTFEIGGAGTVRVVDERRRDAAGARGRAGRHLAHVPDQGCGDPGLGAARGRARRARPARRRCSGSTRHRAHDAQLLRRSRPALEELDTDGLQIEILDVAAAARFTLERARRGRGHDLGHRQRAARLPHGPVPDPRARHEREDALDRAADGRRRTVRDRRRRLGAQARPAVPEGEPPALGLARRVPGAGPSLELLADDRRQPARESCWPTRSTGRPAALLEEDRSPSRKVGELDNRGSHFYLALYWAQELAVAGRRRGAGRALRALAQRLARRRGEDRRRARRRPGLARGHRRLLPAGSRARGRGDAPERDVQRRARALV